MQQADVESFSDVALVLGGSDESLSEEPSVPTLLHETQGEKEKGGEKPLQKRVYHLHRCILSVRSTHFQSMFSLGLKETEEKQISIHDVNPVIFAKVPVPSYS